MVLPVFCIVDTWSCSCRTQPSKMSLWLKNAFCCLLYTIVDPFVVTYALYQEWIWNKTNAFFCKKIFMIKYVPTQFLPLPGDWEPERCGSSFISLATWRKKERQWMIDNGRRRAGLLGSDLGARSRDGERQPPKSSQSPHNTRSQLINFKIILTDNFETGLYSFPPGPRHITLA